MFNYPRLVYFGLVVLLVSLVMILPSCPSAKQQPDSIEIVSASGLVNSYIDWPHLAQETWDNRRVRIHLDAKKYEVIDQEIRCYDGLPKAPPIIVFECIAAPPNNEQPIEIVGICRGRIVDGKKRGKGMDFYIRITECVVTERS